MENSVRKKAAAKKQEYIPRPVRESPLYELKSVSDLGISSLYGVRIDGKEVEVFQNEFFHFAIPVYEKKGREREVEVTIPDNVKSVRLRPASAGISFERDGSVLKFRVPAGLRVNDRSTAICCVRFMFCSLREWKSRKGYLMSFGKERYTISVRWS